MIKHSSDIFTWDRKRNQFVAEASDLQWTGIPSEFQIESSKTGQVRVFYKTFTARDRDNDVQFWRYACRQDTKINALIFND